MDRFERLIGIRLTLTQFSRAVFGGARQIGEALVLLQDFRSENDVNGEGQAKPKKLEYNHYLDPDSDYPVPDTIRLAKPYLASPGATVHGHYREILYEGDTLVTFIYEKSRSGAITQGLPKVEQVLEVHSIDSVSMNLEKSIEGWNK
ncbi:hypothetical protein M9H77_04042 [Catharanthus roseus]|uniref:Uncharacterized protein n=1 Tax=Catharanthus roseus TaxID=4058 RepID=A0ACC0CDE8_CATRO|nr:hypothetical protein M9H77_04042 [Catharanthus roseus]